MSRHDEGTLMIYDVASPDTSVQMVVCDVYQSSLDGLLL